MHPKVLVISNNCFSKTDSNGRTLGNFFIDWPKDSLAQFYIQNASPDFDYCNNYFRVTDGQALQAFKFKKCNGGPVEKKTVKDLKTESDSHNSKPRRNPLTMLIRDFVWRFGGWKKCGFWSWIKEFSPDVVLLQAGDCPFMFDLALKVAKKQSAKLVVYNSEGYYFKDFDYFRTKGLKKTFYPIFRARLKLATKRVYKKVDYAFYICDELKKAYDECFKHNSIVLHTASEFVPIKKEKTHEGFIASYCGNLGLDRHKNLIEIANALQEISCDLFVDVYGKIPSENVKKDFDDCKGIRYHGLIPYSEVKNVLYESDLIIHTESFDDFYKKDLEFAFSTKIADSLSCGTCFMIYAPENMACTKYLQENEAAYVVSEKYKLKDVLSEIVKNPGARNRYLPAAEALASKNHKADKNVEKFQSILRSL